MKAIGIDIGTTTVCAVLIDTSTGRLLESRTLNNASAIEAEHSYEKLQNPSVILAACQELLNSLLHTNPDVQSIGVTGQMHGILYLNQEGQPVSPLYTWQDGRGNLPYDNTVSYVEYMKQATGYSMATGFGLATHFYLASNHMLPDSAVSFCTVPDYIAMSLSGRNSPLLHPSMAASLGLYDLSTHTFDVKALQNLQLDISFLPRIAPDDAPLGLYQDRIPVACALGDNQASFLGSVNGTSNVLVNVGTGSQISVCCSSISPSEQAEYRPYIAGTYLMAGSSLCGGYAYALLHRFFGQTAQMLGADIPADLYKRMNALGSEMISETEHPLFDTRFQGTRSQPSLTGSIQNLTAANFTPGHFIYANLQGICNELYSYYQELPALLRTSGTLIGSGNGIRQNPLLQKIFQETFGMPLSIPLYSEEASYGAALYSMYSGGFCTTLKQLQQLIQYMGDS